MHVVCCHMGESRAAIAAFIRVELSCLGELWGTMVFRVAKASLVKCPGYPIQIVRILGMVLSV